MSSILSSIFSRNRGSRIPVDDHDVNLDLDIDIDDDRDNHNEMVLSRPRVEQMTFETMEEGRNSRNDAHGFEDDRTALSTDANINTTITATTTATATSRPTNPISYSRFQRLHESVSPQRYVPAVTEEQENPPSVITSDSHNIDIATTRNNNIATSQDNMSLTSSTSPTTINQTVTTTFEEQDHETTRARRQSTFLLVVMVFLLKLWVDAIQTGDFGLLLLCLASTVWVSGIIRQRSNDEWNLENGNGSMIGATAGGPGLNRAVMMEDDQRILETMGMGNYQAQLSAAIWESRMLAMMGGIVEREDLHQEGVSEQIQSSWPNFHFKVHNGEKMGTLLRIPTDTNVPSGGRISNDKMENLNLTCEEDATCSICLCEYENRDQLVRLPCSHRYHNDCITSWTRNHIRCPLCNYDLVNGGRNADHRENGNDQATLGGTNIPASISRETDTISSPLQS